MVLLEIATSETETHRRFDRLPPRSYHMSNTNFYEVLGVDADASLEDSEQLLE